MENWQLEYYHAMMRRGRASVIVNEEGHLAAIVTFFIGDDDDKYMLKHTPWTIIEDEPDGTTLYIDQLWIFKKHVKTPKIIYKEFSRFLRATKKTFNNIKRAKWVRVDAQFRKHKVKEGVKRHVHCKDIKF